MAARLARVRLRRQAGLPASGVVRTRGCLHAGLRGGGESRPMWRMEDLGLAHIFWLALVQGATEFLPISSSGHLQLLAGFGAYPPHSGVMDLALHLGSLMGVVVFLRARLRRLAKGVTEQWRGRANDEARAAGLLVLATVPLLVVAAVLVGSGVYDGLRSVEVVAWANLLFALPLYYADRFGGTKQSWMQLRWRGALAVGVLQACALVPGASRSGLCLTAARALGMARVQAVEFTLLLSVPVVAALAVAAAVQLAQAGEAAQLADAALGFGLTALFAFASIRAFLWMSARVSFLPFVLYRLALGAVLLYIF